jgi:hypothetical protein
LPQDALGGESQSNSVIGFSMRPFLGADPRYILANAKASELEGVLVVSDGKFDPADRLRDLEQGASLEEALAFFDGCGLVRMEELLGCWTGSGLPTGHPFDGLLEAFGWHGKRLSR